MPIDAVEAFRDAGGEPAVDPAHYADWIQAGQPTRLSGRPRPPVVLAGRRCERNPAAP